MSRKYKNSVIIEDDYVLKKRNDNIINLYDYLSSCNVENFPSIIDYDSEYIRSKYIDGIKYHESTKNEELIKTIASVHSKTVYYKDIDYSSYESIYKRILGNIEYLKEYYEDLISNIEDEEYMSPSHYLFARNYSSILGSLKYCESNIKRWKTLVKNKTSERVVVVHNNLSSDHFIKGDKNYLLSWDKYLVDTPILDLYKFYKKEGFKCNFKMLYEKYNEIFKLLPEEDLLFKILISMPPLIKFKKDELSNIRYIIDSYKYVFNSYKIVS